MGMLPPARAIRESRADPLDLNDIRRLVDLAFTRQSNRRSGARRVMHALLSEPGYLTIPEITERAWPDPEDEPEDPDSHVPALLWWLRPILRAEGYEIARAKSPRTRFGRYRIERR